MGVLVFAYTRTGFYYPLATVVLSAFVITVVIFQPYKLIIHNAIDSFLILSVIICYSAAMAKIISQAKTRSNSFLKISVVLIFFSTFNACLLYCCTCCILVSY